MNMNFSPFDDHNLMMTSPSNTYLVHPDSSSAPTNLLEDELQKYSLCSKSMIQSTREEDQGSDMCG